MPEVNSEPSNFLTFMNNDKAFHSLDGMACSYQCPDDQGADNLKGIGFLETFKNPIY